MRDGEIQKSDLTLPVATRVINLSVIDIFCLFNKLKSNALSDIDYIIICQQQSDDQTR